MHCNIRNDRFRVIGRNADSDELSFALSYRHNLRDPIYGDFLKKPPFPVPSKTKIAAGFAGSP